MCKALDEGGQRCASHTRGPAYEALRVLAKRGGDAWDIPDEHMDAIAAYASTPMGALEVKEVRATYEEDGEDDAVAFLDVALDRGQRMREVNAAVKTALKPSKTPSKSRKKAGAYPPPREAGTIPTLDRFNRPAPRPATVYDPSQNKRDQSWQLYVFDNWRTVNAYSEGYDAETIDDHLAAVRHWREEERRYNGYAESPDAWRNRDSILECAAEARMVAEFHEDAAKFLKNGGQPPKVSELDDTLHQIRLGSDSRYADYNFGRVSSNDQRRLQAVYETVAEARRTNSPHYKETVEEALDEIEAVHANADLAPGWGGSAELASATIQWHKALAESAGIKRPPLRNKKAPVVKLNIREDR